MITYTKEVDNYGFDDFGVYTEPGMDPIPIYDYKVMKKYCNDISCEIKDISDEERDSFLIEWVSFNRDVEKWISYRKKPDRKTT